MIVDWLNPFSANKWGGGDDGNSNTSSGTSFFEDPLGGLTDIWDSMTGGGDTNNNQEINININATGGNSELANDIGRQVGIEVQEIQRRGSPR